jgi:hypothetical protein
MADDLLRQAAQVLAWGAVVGAATIFLAVLLLLLLA